MIYGVSWHLHVLSKRRSSQVLVASAGVSEKYPLGKSEARRAPSLSTARSVCQQERNAAQTKLVRISKVFQGLIEMVY